VWWFNLLTTEPLTFASFDSWGGTVAELLDATVGHDDLHRLRKEWKGSSSSSSDDAAARCDQP
jgi:hypothetical protein